MQFSDSGDGWNAPLARKFISTRCGRYQRGLTSRCHLTPAAGVPLASLYPKTPVLAAASHEDLPEPAAPARTQGQDARQVIGEAKNAADTPHSMSRARASSPVPASRL